MISRRTAISLLASASMISATSVAFAKQKHHQNGHAMLGERIKKNGKHHLHKAGKVDVSADVNNGKVVALTANDPAKGNLPVTKVRSKKKFADAIDFIPVGAGTQLAQYTDYYYAYCFTDGIDDWCYWFPADAVVVDNTWVDYTG